MNLKQLEQQRELSEQGATVTIYQLNGEPYLAPDGSECTVTVVGPESKRVKAARKANTQKAFNKRRLKLDAEMVERNRVTLAAAAVVDWHGWTVEVEGKDVAAELTPENLHVLLSYDHILEQVEAAVQDHADFFTTA